MNEEKTPIKLENKTITIGNLKSGYFDLALAAVDCLPSEGITTSEMRARINLANKIREAVESADLEPSELAVLQYCVRTCRWKMMSRTLLDFEEYVKNLQ